MADLENSYKRAYRSIINHVVSYTTTRSYFEPDGVTIKRFPATSGFFIDESYSRGENFGPKKGDLVLLGSAPDSEWYLSWYEEKVHHYYDDYDELKEPSRYEVEHLLRSVETQKLCNWSNVSIYFLDRKELENYPSWKWNDAQFKFKDLWWDICYKDMDAYILIPVYPEFGEGHEVTLRLRVRFSDFGEAGFAPEITFPDYREVTKKQIIAFYKDAQKSREKK